MNFFRLQSKIDTEPLLKEAIRYPHFWNVNTSRQDTIYVQRETKTIMLRISTKIPDGVSIKNHLDSEDGKLYSWFPKTKRFMNNFVKTYGGEFGRVYIVLLPLNKMVYPHIDDGEYYKNSDRFHLILTGKYMYHIENESQLFEEGDLWYFDNKKVHYSKTVGEKDRIAIIFDVKNSNWRQNCNL
jgi:hypothetical protein